MSQIQVIGREDNVNENFQKFSEDLRKQQEAQMKAREISSTLKNEKTRLSILSKSADTEEKKFKMSQELQNASLGEAYWNNIISSNTEGGKINLEGVEKAVATISTDPKNEGVVKYLSNMFKSQGPSAGPDVEKTAAETRSKQTGDRLNQAKIAQMEAVNRLISGEGIGSQTGNVAGDLGADLSGQSNSPILGAEGDGGQMPSAVRARAAALSSAARPETTGGQTRGGYQVGDITMAPAGTTIKLTNPKQEVDLVRAKKRVQNIEELKKTGAGGFAIVDQLDKDWHEAFPNMPEKGSVFQPTKFVRRGLWNTYKGLTQADTKMQSYITTKKATLSLLVRALGEKGMLTDHDVKRIEQAIPGQATSKAVAKENFAAIKNIMLQGMMRYINDGGSQSDISSVVSSSGKQGPKKATKDVTPEDIANMSHEELQALAGGY